ncbi:MAG: FG-GAP and VCBS repeat-containing protein [Planctomycetota bacterium]|nr:FG-GAP and VCBS repeat-containing protein [Planctomycetota bacterium]
MPNLMTLLTVMALLATPVLPDDLPKFEWRSREIDKISVGYGLQMADVNGDGKTDIVLADQKTIQWYQNPSWTKHVIAKNLTTRDNVCVTARDIDGDGKCEIAVGGQWNYRESIKDGAVFYLIPPGDRTKAWTPVKLHNEPSVHRMHWVRGRNNNFHLHVKPLRGRGSVIGDVNGLRILEYTRPGKPNNDWTFEVVCDFMHLSHNFHVVNWDSDQEEEIIVAGKEGVWHFDKGEDTWKPTQLTQNFSGEIRDGRLPNGKRFIATVEPKHGSVAAVYSESPNWGSLWNPVKVLDNKLKDGHAVACADFLGIGSDQIVVGWRAMNDPGIPGIKMFTPTNPEGTQWRETVISSEKVAVEDIKVADLNGDGKTDIVAAARQTKNLVIFFNETQGFKK